MACSCKKNKQIQNPPVTVKVAQVKKNDELVNKIVNKLKKK